MSNFEAFLTGFLGRTADIIKERKDTAEDYFNQSIERARTIGQDNLRQRLDNQQAMLSIANNLVSQAGMPEQLVREIANDGPAALEQAYQIYQTNAEAGVAVDESFWRNVYDFTSEVTAGSDMSLEDFFKQVNGLYANNLAATTQEGGDPFGAFIASGLGLNAMDRAQDRLGEYDIGGYSAADLLAMESRPSTTSPLGETGFAGPDLSVAIPRETESPYDPTPEERLRIIERFDEAVTEEAAALFDEYQTQFVGGEDTPTLTEQDFVEQARANIAQAYQTSFAVEGIDFASVFPELSVYLPQEEGPVEKGSVVDTEDPRDGTGVLSTPQEDPVEEPPPPTVESPEAPAPREAEVSAPTAYDPNQTDIVLSNGTTAQYVGTTPEGLLRYRLEDGTYRDVTPQEVEEVISRGEAERIPQMGLGTLDPSVPLNDE